MKRIMLILFASIMLCGCAIPVGVKRCYVDTWDHFYPPSTNEVAK
jgi:hypothetical protein